MTDPRYPPLEPFERGKLDVGEGHRLYWEQCGNPTGKPAVVLHGGPGSGCSPGLRRWFDPARYRIVLFDQRNCGRSTPFAGDAEVDLSANTTPHLVEDIERLREHLGIDRWLVWGGSWGVTLALAYAQSHPGRVSELVLGGVTSGTRRETDWITRDMGRVFPEEWARFTGHLGGGEPDGNGDADIAAAYSRLLHDPDAAVREAAALAWCRWEDTHVSLLTGPERDLQSRDPAFRLCFARLVTHYWGNDCFLADGQLLRGVGRLEGIPGVLVHGRADVSSPLDTAWRLAQAWPDAELAVVEKAGHFSGSGMTEALVAATDRFA